MASMSRHDKAIEARKVTALMSTWLRKASGFHALMRNPLFQRSLLLVVMSLVLAVLFTPRFRPAHHDYTVGMIAPRDVRADRDVLVLDKKATEQRKKEAAREAKAVYDYDSELVSAIRASLTKTFTEARKTAGRGVREGNAPDAERLYGETKRIFEKNAGISLTKEEIAVLAENGFSPSLMEKIIGLVTALYSEEYITSGIFLEQDIEKGIVVRDVKTGLEAEHLSLPSIRHINDIRATLERKADTIFAKERTAVRWATVSLALRLVQPNLIFNRDATAKKREMLRDEIKPVYFKVRENETIVRAGEKITPHHLDVLVSLEKSGSADVLSRLFSFFGLFLVIALLFAVLYYPTRSWLKNDRRNVHLLFLATVAVLQVLLVRAGIFLAEAVSRSVVFITADAYIYAIPFTLGAMLVGIVINRNVALLFSLVSSLLLPLLFAGSVHLSLFCFIGCAVASYRIAHSAQPSGSLKVGLLVGVVNGVVIVFLGLLQGYVAVSDLLLKLLMGLLGGVMSGIIVAGIVPLCESLFGYTTDVKLMELANLNRPIFQRMILEAPGTYHHSIVVASMVEAAAEAIGANALLAKVSAYYHDIGKMKKPLYFIENQQNGENRHERLSPKMSSLVIMSHVKDGCELAQGIKLGPEITNIIREHHGTSMVSYFYEKAKRDKDLSIRALPESDFRYPGPKPQTREAGLVLLGDVMEASSRSLTQPTPSRIRNLVRERIEKIFLDGQLDECDLTLQDLTKIADSFIRILNGIFHHRIRYPEPVVRDIHDGRRNGHDNSHKKRAEKDKGGFAASAAGSP
jgi:cyclic-di-AMP phosphodiesterase PgpH